MAEGRDENLPRVLSYKPTHGIVLICAAPQMGKTVLLHYLVERHRQKGHVFLVRDTMGHWPRKPGLHLFHDEDPERLALHAIELTKKLGHGVTLVIDEAWEVFPAVDPPRKGSALYSIMRTARQAKLLPPHARPHPVPILCATQRPKDLTTDLRNLATRLYLGHISGPSDLKWVREATQDRELERRLPRLERGQFIAVELN